MGTSNSEESELDVWRTGNVSGKAQVQGRAGEEMETN